MLRVLLATASVLLFAVVGCGKNAPQGPTGEAACTKVDAPLMDAGTNYDSEPRVKLPVPDGWERYAGMDAGVARLAIINKSLMKNAFTPNAVYTLDKLPGNIEASKALKQERDGLEKTGGATDLVVTPDTVCGFPGQTMHYTATIPPSVGPHPGVMREAVLNSGNNTYVITVVLQTTDPDNPVWQRDSKTILDGLQILPPANPK